MLVGYNEKIMQGGHPCPRGLYPIKRNGYLKNGAIFLCVEGNGCVYAWARGAHPTGLFPRRRGTGIQPIKISSVVVKTRILKQIQRRHPRMTLSGIQNVDGLKTGFPIRSASGMTGMGLWQSKAVMLVGYSEKIM